MQHFQTGIPDGTYPLQLGGIADSASRDHPQPFVEKFLWLLGQHCNTKLASIQPFLFSWPEKEVLFVIIKPGEMQFTRAKSVHSTAKLLARCTAAALEALYATCV